MVTALIAGNGTSEAIWRPWLASRDWPLLDTEQLAGRRAVVLAAHPDDEVLGVGGLLRWLAAAGIEIVAVWASDGEASHPDTTVIEPPQLAAARRAESLVALQRLDVRPVSCLHLGLPDGGLANRGDELTAALRRVVRSDDVLLAPWRGDGHPDHEAVGEAAARLGNALIEYPIWMWHWALPGDGRVPWERARTFAAVDVHAKTLAIDAFQTQTRPLGPDPADAAILPPHVVDRFRRPDEVVFG